MKALINIAVRRLG